MASFSAAAHTTTLSAHLSNTWLALGLTLAMKHGDSNPTMNGKQSGSQSCGVTTATSSISATGTLTPAVHPASAPSTRTHFA